MNLEKTKNAIILCFTFSIITNFPAEASSCEVLDRSRMAHLDVECLSFTNTPKTLPINVLDVTKDDVIQIFQELKDIHFPIYTLSCFAPRDIRGGGLVSMHSYAAAIDINYLMNPHYDVIKGTMIPTRKKDRREDKESMIKELESINIPESEIKAILETVIQPAGSDDRFLNRGIIRKGMVTPEVVSIFRAHGFSVWGGTWRQPMDYMHFQLPRALAEQLSKASVEESTKIWEQHKKHCN